MSITKLFYPALGLLARTCLATAMSLSLAAHAGQVTIGFEGMVADDGDAWAVLPYTESGYTIASSSTGNPSLSDGIFGKDFAGANTNGSAILGFCAFDSTCLDGTFLSLTGATPFSLLSIDTANWSLGDVPGSLELIGHLLGGGEVQTVLSTVDEWNTYFLEDFVNLVSLDLVGYGAFTLAMDNLVIDAPNSVPEPASLALMGVALLGLARARRQWQRQA